MDDKSRDDSSGDPILLCQKSANHNYADNARDSSGGSNEQAGGVEN
jgi:hypothetical protein